MSAEIANEVEKIHGGCQCGELRYEVSCPLTDPVVCHCRMCQKAFGNFGAVLASVSPAQFRWTRGTPGTFRSSSMVTRGFCHDCGTPMFMHEDDGDIDLAVGTLDNPNLIPPLTRQSAVASRVSWFATMHSLPEEQMEDYRTPDELEKLKSFQHPDHET